MLYVSILEATDFKLSTKSTISERAAVDIDDAKQNEKNPEDDEHILLDSDDERKSQNDEYIPQPIEPDSSPKPEKRPRKWIVHESTQTFWNSANENFRTFTKSSDWW